MKEMLKISGISYEINSVPLFEQISASVQQGDIIGVIGKNGAGKSLLLAIDLQSKSAVTRTDPDDARCEHIYGGTRNGSL